ncbi:MAG: hypothetical protein ABGY96_04215 [bacterium]
MSVLNIVSAADTLSKQGLNDEGRLSDTLPLTLAAIAVLLYIPPLTIFVA